MPADSYRQRFERAFHSSEPGVALSRLAKALKAEGMGQSQIFQLFDEFQRKTVNNDPRFDMILDIMDFICGNGWAKGAEGRCLFETELTNKDIAELGPAPDFGREVGLRGK